MPKRSSKHTPPPADENQAAYQIVQQLLGTPEPADEGKNPAAVLLGRLGGKKGGPARAKKLSKVRRRQIASTAARKRWKAYRQRKNPEG
jgi:DNA polymerase IIIc chi subunit